jgi:molybdate-binding protein
MREPGSAERKCLDDLLAPRSAVEFCVNGYMTVAEAVREGWAAAGGCVSIAAEDAGLVFLPFIRNRWTSPFQFRMPAIMRVRALIHLLRSRSHRRLVSELPGYDANHTGEWIG